MSRSAFLHNYVTTLSGIDLTRYEVKVELCGGEDPYEMSVSEWNVFPVVPDVTMVDLVSYLVLKTDFYSLQQMKNYKALEAHNYITSGHIQGCTTKALGNEKAIVFGKVTHSQCVNQPALKCWILMRLNGEVLTGHCNCMAGVGEVCSHVGALLFCLELMAVKKRETTCTSQPNGWLPPAQSSGRMRTIEDCDFRAAGTKWKDLLNGCSGAPAKLHRPLTATAQRVDELLRKVQSAGIDSAVLRVWEGLQPTLDTTVPPVPLPLPLGSLFNEKFAKLPFAEILAHCERVYTTIAITKEEAINLERVSRGQHSNPTWMEHRGGRITASRMKDVCRTNVQNPSVSLLKAICYPAAYNFSTVHTRRGIKDEPAILEEFTTIMSREHHDFEVIQCGLIVNTRYPFLGASPDALTFCTCHGGGVVEVKSISVDCKENTGLLNGKLDRNHKFFYQVQTQMLVCKLAIGYFAERKPNGEIYVEKIEPDCAVQTEIVAKVVPFFKHAVLPELICKYFSSESHILPSLVPQSSRNNLSICICKKSPLAPMINCSEQNCAITTFHKKCVGITRNLRKWTCPDCTKQKVLRNARGVKQ